MNTPVTAEPPSTTPVPVLEPDALTLPVDPAPAVGELGAVSFARDIAVWLARIFDRPIEKAVYRQNPWDHRHCPHAQTYEYEIAGHTIVITAYEQDPTPASSGFVHAISVDAHPVPYAPRPRPLREAWHLAWHAWHATA